MIHDIILCINGTLFHQVKYTYWHYTMKSSLVEKEMFKAVDCLQPSRPILCTTKNDDKTDHVAPFGWCFPVSQNPPMLAIAIHHFPTKSRSLINIERTKEFVVNIPTAQIAEEAIGTSLKVGKGQNKFDRSGFTRTLSTCVGPVGIEECVASLECEVCDLRYFGDHALVIGEIVCAHFDPEVFDENMLWRIQNARPLIHLGHKVTEEKNQIHYLFDGCCKVLEINCEKLNNKRSVS